MYSVTKIPINVTVYGLPMINNAACEVIELHQKPRINVTKSKGGDIRQEKPRDELTRDEIKLLSKQATLTRNGLRDWLAIQLTYTCALRSAELVGLKWSHVDLGSSQITINRAKQHLDKKTGKRKVKRHDVKLSPKVKKALVKLKKEMKPTPSDPIIASEQQTVTGEHKPMTTSWFRKLMIKLNVVKGKNGTDVNGGLLGFTPSPHQLRHSGCTHLAEAVNGNLLMIKNFAGHADTKTSEGYVNGAAFQYPDVFE